MLKPITTKQNLPAQHTAGKPFMRCVEKPENLAEAKQYAYAAKEHGSPEEREPIRLEWEASPQNEAEQRK